MSMKKAVQCNAEQLAGRIIKKDSRSNPPQFCDPHWNQNPRRSSFLFKGNGHPLRSGINYMQSSPRTTYLVSPQTSNEHILEKTHLTLFQKTLIGRRPSLSTGFKLQEDEPHITGSYYYGRPKRVSKRKDIVLRTLAFINKEEDSSKEAPDLSKLTQQSYYTHNTQFHIRKLKKLQKCILMTPTSK